MLRYHGDYATDLMAAEALVLCNLQRVEPDLYRRSAFVDVNMRWLVGLMAEKVEAVAALAKNSGHSPFIAD